MQSFRNLVPDSTLIHEAIQLLRRQGGRASAVEVADTVLQLPELDPPLAATLVAELIKDDWRLRVDDGTHDIELLCEDDELRSLADTDYVVFDVETTGPKTPPGRIMELGACRVSGGRIVGEFQTLVNPRAPIPPFISQLTGISDTMVSAAPLFAEIAPAWLEFADRAVLVAHNAPFDIRFINHELSLVYPGRRMSNAHICTVSLARRAVPELPSHRLHLLAEHFAVHFPRRHRAGDDARATAEVFIRLLERLRRDGVHDLASARQYKRPEANGRKSEAKGQKTGTVGHTVRTSPV
ncbi:MAG TPA: exonuclease domain-containing protein [Pyrinomonadaceae bacterium]